MMGGKAVTNLISVQATYRLYEGGNGVITCDDVINIPLAYTVPRQVKINSGSYEILPAVEFDTSIDVFKFKIITNEGTTVEPFTASSMSDVINPYGRDRFFFVLPKGTTGIKDVIINSKYEGFSSALEFGIMHPPYNYDNALFGVITSEVLDTEQEVENLKDMVNDLNLVTNSPYFSVKLLPKGAGRQTINIEKGMLYFHTILNFLNINGDKPLNLTITLNNGSLDKSFTIALTKGVEAVTVDLLAGGIFVYLPSTGEVLKELRFGALTSAYKTISYEGFDDILLDKLQVTISGRKIA